LRSAVRDTTGEFRNFGDEELVGIIPVKNDFVFTHL
jgi:hypothetical protein